MSEEFKRKVKNTCDEHGIKTTIVLKDNEGEKTNEIKQTDNKKF